jgi:hypothetical protein
MFLVLLGGLTAQTSSILESQRKSTQKVVLKEWSEEGAFGLKWGMSKADVERTFPELRVVVPNMATTHTIGFIEQVIQGLKCSVGLSFREDKLHEIHVNTTPPFKMGQTEEWSVELDKQRRESRWKWRNTILPVLKEGYGNPICAPSDYTRTRICDTVAPPPGCGSQEDVNLLKWVWRTNRTQVVLTGGYVPTLTYSDLLVISIAAQEQAEARADYRRRTERTATDDARKLVGGVGQESPQPPATAPTSTTRQADVSMEPPPIVCPEDPTLISENLKVPSTEWSSVGWENLRWGMGPADVRSLLKASGKALGTWNQSSAWEQRLFLSEGFKVFGQDVSAFVTFKKGRLSSIHFSLFCADEPSSPTLKSCEALASRAKSSLTKQAGEPRIGTDEYSLKSTWARGSELWAVLSTDRKEGQSRSVSLAFDDPATHPTVAPRTFAKKTHPKPTWSTRGWLDFRWGMGPADFKKVLSDPKGQIKASRSPWFLADRTTPGLVTCLIESDSHSYSICGATPELEFTFTDAKLSKVFFKFPQGASSADCKAREDIRNLLQTKYGAPKQDHSGSTRYGKYTTLQWELEGLSIFFSNNPESSNCHTELSYSNPTVPSAFQLKKLGGTKEVEKL